MHGKSDFFVSERSRVRHRSRVDLRVWYYEGSPPRPRGGAGVGVARPQEGLGVGV